MQRRRADQLWAESSLSSVDSATSPPSSADSAASLSSVDRDHLDRALDLAAHGPAADPNPRVGAVIVDLAGHVVGEGWHQGAGTDHAEVMALVAAGERARGGTAYVTLEPCRHHGRTGPCTQALLGAGIDRVVFAYADPSPDAGSGATELTAAGVTVHALPPEDPLAGQAAELVEAWSFAIRHGRPRVVWKTATTLDGRSAAADGTSQWITAPATRARGHQLRAECGAILVGTGTALADDPALTVRLGQDATRIGLDGSRPAGSPGPGEALSYHRPLRVVLGERDLPPNATLRDDAAPTLLLRHRDPARALVDLHTRGVRQVLLEGGPTLAAAFLRDGLVDRVVLHLAPLLLGAGRTLGDFGVDTLSGAHRLTIRSVEHLDPDVIVIADVHPSSPDSVTPPDSATN